MTGSKLSVATQTIAIHKEIRAKKLERITRLLKSRVLGRVSSNLFGHPSTRLPEIRVIFCKIKLF
jgi:hypothetical protein